MIKFKKIARCVVLPLAIGAMLTGCGAKTDSGKVQINLLQYKPEAATYFDKLEEKFNATHDNIVLNIESPNDAMTVLKTRLIREDDPDIVGIGGDINYAYFLDSDLFLDISDYKGVKEIKKAYLDIDKNLELVPKNGTYAVPYAANAAGILYNKEMFEEHGWKIPSTYDEFISLCKQIQSEGVMPLYFGYKDTWTTLAPWNAIASSLAPADICQQVNRGEATFKKAYEGVATIMEELLPYGPKQSCAYAYNDACTAFAKGESAMYAIGSYAVPQIKSVNPDMKIDSFVFPATDKEETNILTSGIDLQFSVMKGCENKEAAYEVLDFLISEENLQDYAIAQNSVPCKEGDFKLTETFDGMKKVIDEGRMVDYQDHYYPSEMAVDSLIQTFILDKDKEAFLNRFDKEWPRYNRSIIAKVKKYQESQK